MASWDTRFHLNSDVDDPGGTKKRVGWDGLLLREFTALLIVGRKHLDRSFFHVYRGSHNLKQLLADQRILPSKWSVNSGFGT